MSPDLAAEITRMAGDARNKVDTLTAQIAYRTPAGAVPNEFLRYLDLAATLLETAAQEITTDGLYVTPEPADLDTADPEDKALVDQLLAEYATA